MWRMIKAGIMGILIGVVGGVIAGHISYVKNYKNRLDREIISNAVMYNGTSKDDRIIRLKVDYDGDYTGINDIDQIESYVGNSIMRQVSGLIGEYDNDEQSYIQTRHSLVMAMDQIKSLAGSAASDLGIDAVAETGFSYEYFDADGEGLPAGYYETLCINLQDR